MLCKHEGDRKMKCKDCDFLVFEKHKSGVNRYYCKNTIAAAEVQAAARIICRTERRTTELKIKTVPRWCPLAKKVK